MIKIKILSIDNSDIRARINQQGSVEHLCLNDIVKYLDRAEMTESGRVLKICKSVTRQPFKDGGRNRWAIKPYDIHYLINEVSGENGLMDNKCLRLQNWINALPIKMQNIKPSIFTYQDKFPITSDAIIHQSKQQTSQPANMSVPKSFDEALQLVANQARKLRESEHKVNFYDDFVEGRNNFKSSRIADELEISVVSLHRFLAEEGIVHFERKRRRWVVNGAYRPLQCDTAYLWQREDGKVYPFGTVKRWTQAGREYIIELWNEKSDI